MKKASARKLREVEAPREALSAIADLADRLERIERFALSLDQRAKLLEKERAAAPPPIRLKAESPPGKTAVRRQIPAKRRPGEVRCPGCSLPSSEPLKRCPFCGFLFSVLPPSRRPGLVSERKRPAPVAKKTAEKKL